MISPGRSVWLTSPVEASLILAVAKLRNQLSGQLNDRILTPEADFACPRGLSMYITQLVYFGDQDD